MLFNLLICAALTFFAGIYGTRTGDIIVRIYGALMIFPTLSVSVRRLHDTGRNGIWLLIGLIPIVGTLVLLFFMIQKGDQGENMYGNDPKLVDESIAI